jgi:hypothetical protein
MVALQKYWKTRQVKMLFFTSFIGLFTFIMMFLSIITIAKDGLADAINDPVVSAGLLEFPATFMLLLLMHKVFNAFAKGQFFASSTLQTLLVCAKLAMIYGLVIKPGVMVSLMFIGSVGTPDIMLYFTYVGLSTAIVGYILHMGVSTHKISREIEEEQELVV